MAIRTPDQRLRVFVSSTLGELAAERRAVSRAITALRLTPVLFELGARPHPPQELYRAYLEQSDVFIGLYWQRYGWIGPGMRVSGLEDEFDLALARGQQVEKAGWAKAFRDKNKSERKFPWLLSSNRLRLDAAIMRTSTLVAFESPTL